MKRRKNKYGDIVDGIWDDLRAKYIFDQLVISLKAKKKKTLDSIIFLLKEIKCTNHQFVKTVQSIKSFTD